MAQALSNAAFTFSAPALLTAIYPSHMQQPFCTAAQSASWTQALSALEIAFVKDAGMALIPTDFGADEQAANTAAQTVKNNTFFIDSPLLDKIIFIRLGRTHAHPVLAGRIDIHIAHLQRAGRAGAFFHKKGLKRGGGFFIYRFFARTHTAAFVDGSAIRVNLARFGGGL